MCGSETSKIENIPATLIILNDPLLDMTISLLLLVQQGDHRTPRKTLCESRIINRTPLRRGVWY